MCIKYSVLRQWLPRNGTYNAFHERDLQAAKWADGVRLRLRRASPPGYYGNNRITKSGEARVGSPDGPSGLNMGVVC